MAFGRLQFTRALDCSYTLVNCAGQYAAVKIKHGNPDGLRLSEQHVKGFIDSQQQYQGVWRDLEPDCTTRCKSAKPLSIHRVGLVVSLAYRALSMAD